MNQPKRYDPATEMDVYTPTSQDILNDYQRDEFATFQREYEDSHRGDEE